MRAQCDWTPRVLAAWLTPLRTALAHSASLCELVARAFAIGPSCREPDATSPSPELKLVWPGQPMPFWRGVPAVPSAGVGTRAHCHLSAASPDSGRYPMREGVTLRRSVLHASHSHCTKYPSHTPLLRRSQSCRPLVAHLSTFIGTGEGATQPISLMLAFVIGVGMTALALASLCMCRRWRRQAAGQKGLYTFGAPDVADDDPD